MLTPDTLEHLQQADAIAAAAEEFRVALTRNKHALALPSSMTLHDIEPYHPTRRRARGTVTTADITSFAVYIKTHQEDGASIFVDGATLGATAILNLGTPTQPGHADNTVKLKAEHTAAYTALNHIIARSAITQRDLAEFLEEWADHIAASHTLGGEAIQTPHAIAAVRDLTIEGTKRQQAADQQLSASRSTFEQVTARGSNGTLPGALTFKAAPCSFLPEHTFAIRVGVLTGEAKPTFALRIVKPEEHKQKMAVELADAIKDQNTGLPVHLGSYTRGT